MSFPHFQARLHSRAHSLILCLCSPFTPLMTLKYMIEAQKHLPPGVLNVVVGDDSLGPMLTEHPTIDHVSCAILFLFSIPAHSSHFATSHRSHSPARPQLAAWLRAAALLRSSASLSSSAEMMPASFFPALISIRSHSRSSSLRFRTAGNSALLPK